LLSGHSLLNVESVITLGFLAMLFVRSRKASVSLQDPEPSRYPTVFFALFCAILIVYWPILGAPFVYDDYTHISDAQHSTIQLAMASFGPVTHKPGLFFRPFGFLVYWLNYLVTGADPRLWHAVSIAFHAINACLFFTLCRQLRFNLTASAGAAFLFALNAASVEAVAWIDARFDPMATGLALASLLCVCRFADSGRYRWLVVACLAGACGMLSKESAFCLPLLAASLSLLRAGVADRSRLARACACLAMLAIALFAYRWWALGGIGGYRGAGGEVNIGQFSPLRTLNAVFVRDWTILFFPVNWSSRPGWLLTGLIYTAPFALIACAWLARMPRRVIIGCVVLTTLAALPVQHLLLIGTDLANTRIAYLLSVGWALLWGGVFGAIPGTRWRVLAIVWLLTWHTVMLRHNLNFWLNVPREAQSVCAAFGRTVATAPGQEPAVVRGLPQKKNGVAFLANGFPECVEMNSDVPASRVMVNGHANFEWNETIGRIQRLP
jgi:hypothetical protein